LRANSCINVRVRGKEAENGPIRNCHAIPGKRIGRKTEERAEAEGNVHGLRSFDKKVRGTKSKKKKKKKSAESSQKQRGGSDLENRCWMSSF